MHDLLPALKKVLEAGWKVEIYMYAKDGWVQKNATKEGISNKHVIVPSASTQQPDNSHMP